MVLGLLAVPLTRDIRTVKGPDLRALALRVTSSGVYQAITLGHVLSIFLGLWVIYAIGKGIYNLYFHPLSKFPGPKIAGMTNLYKTYAANSGKFHLISQRLHDTYGPVVRIGPNHLSYASITALRTIYSHPQGSSGIWTKSGQYDVDKEFAETNLVTERDPVKHGRMRKLFANVFSSKALGEQEDLVQRYVDLLMHQLGKYGAPKSKLEREASSGDGPNGADILQFFNWATFDIIGDLAFGRSFGSLAAAKPHFWVELIFSTIKLSAIMVDLQAYPWIHTVIEKFVIKHLLIRPIRGIKDKHFGYSHDLIVKRINSETVRKDFMSHILAEWDTNPISVDELVSQAAIFVIAGSESTANFLIGTTYHLLRNPGVYNKLVTEIRSKFSSDSEITSDSTLQCEYLNLVIEEGLRIFPPAPTPLPRISPGGVVDGEWVPEGTIVCVCSRSISRSPTYWHRPNSFIPERWMDSPPNPEFSSDTKDASQPFSTGPRSCMGRNLAYMEMRLILAKMVWLYDLELTHPEKDWEAGLRMFLMWEKPGLDITFKKVVREK